MNPTDSQKQRDALASGDRHRARPRRIVAVLRSRRLHLETTRREHGFVATARRLTMPLLRQGLIRGRFGLLWLGLHVVVPPLALLLALNGGVMLVLTLGWALGASAVPLAIDVLFVGLIGLGVILA